MISSNYPRVASITFDTSHENPFPTLGQLLGSSYEGCPDELAHFYVVAEDPSRLGCYDEWAQAMDTTNYDVFRSYVPTVSDESYDVVTLDTNLVSTFGDEVLGAVDAGAAIYRAQFSTVIIVNPTAVDLVDIFAGLRDSLQDYPLLDEEAYSTLDYEAFADFVMTGGMQSDVTSDLRLAGVDEETVDSIDEAWEAIAPAAASTLDCYNGFEGSCDPSFEEAVAKVIVEALTPRTLVVLSTVENLVERAATLGAEHGRNAASWFNINSAVDAAEILRGIDEGDPQFMDLLPSPDLGGEWADSFTERDLLRALDLPDNDEGIVEDICVFWAERDAAVEAYREAFESAATAEVVRAATYLVDEALTS